MLAPLPPPLGSTVVLGALVVDALEETFPNTVVDESKLVVAGKGVEVVDNSREVSGAAVMAPDGGTPPPALAPEVGDADSSSESESLRTCSTTGSNRSEADLARLTTGRIKSSGQRAVVVQSVRHGSTEDVQ